jgi:hypothetical protein
MEASRRIALAYRWARLAVVLVWLWHGLVPKLIVRHPDEALPLINAGFSESTAWTQVTIAGFLEIGMAIAVVVWWRHRWPLMLTMIGMAAAIIGVALTAPMLFLDAFNPLTFSITVGILALVAWLLHPLRQQQPDQEL